MNLIGIPFEFVGMTYYQCPFDITIGSKVIVTNDFGTFLATVSKVRKASDQECEKENFNQLFPPIDRIANSDEIKEDEKLISYRKDICSFAQKQADELSLDMDILNCFIDLSSDKLLITYLAESRVDFRELVKILMAAFRKRIELRQLGPRDHASLIGGIGPCGLPLCCSTFLTEFDGISINMAKNQLLVINTAKLSGQCGKLLCCLKFEDESYTIIKKDYPDIGEVINYKNSQYKVVSINVLSDTITCYNNENYESFTKEEYQKAKKGIAKKENNTVVDINANVNLSGKGVQDTKNRIQQIKRDEKERKETENIDKNRQNKQQNKNKNKNNNQNINRFDKNDHKKQSEEKKSNRNNKNKNNFKGNFNNHFSFSKHDDGFIPVSEIKDRSILESDKDDKK